MGIHKGHVNGNRLRVAPPVVGQINGDLQPALPIVVPQARLHEQVPNVQLWRCPKKNVPLDPADPPEVLTFQIASVAPPVDLHGQEVLSGADEVGDIEFGR